MNIACSTCLESFTSRCDISTTPCGHVFHTGCITRWLNGNNNCSQCRKGCEIGQIIKLYFSESQSAIEEQITINDLEQKSLQMEEESQEYIQEVNALKKLVLDKSIEITQANQKCKRLEHEKLLMKLDWSKTEWNLKELLNKGRNFIKDLEKEIHNNSIQITLANKNCKILEQEKLEMKSDWSKTEWILIDSINKANKQIKVLEKEIDVKKIVDIRALQFCGFSPESNQIPIKNLEKEIKDQKMVDKNKSGFKRKREDFLITIKKVNLTFNDEQLILEIIDNLNRIQNRLRVGITSTYVLYNDYKDFWEYYLRKLSAIPSNANFEEHIGKLEKWLNILNNLNVSKSELQTFGMTTGNPSCNLSRFGQLTDNQVREMCSDFNDANEDLKNLRFKKFIHHS